MPNRCLHVAPPFREIKTPVKTARQILVEDNGCEFGPIRARGSRGLLVGGEPEVLPGLLFPSPLKEPAAHAWQPVAMVTVQLWLAGRKQIAVRAKGGRRGRRGRVSGFKQAQQKAVGFEPAEALLCCNCCCLRLASSPRQVALADSAHFASSHVTGRARLSASGCVWLWAVQCWPLGVVWGQDFVKR